MTGIPTATKNIKKSRAKSQRKIGQYAWMIKTEDAFQMSRIGGFITMVVLMHLTSFPSRHSGTGFLLLIGPGISMGPISILYKLPFGSTLSEREE